MFRIQHANLMKDIYTLKEINKTCFERIYVNNRLKRFKVKNAENSSTEQIEIHKMLNITFKNSIDAMKKSNIINENVRINDEIRDEIVRNIIQNFNTDDQIFEDVITNNNLLNSKFENIYMIVNFSTRRSNQLIEIKNSLNNIDRKTKNINFATIDKVSIEKK